MYIKVADIRPHAHVQQLTEQNIQGRTVVIYGYPGEPGEDYLRLHPALDPDNYVDIPKKGIAAIQEDPQDGKLSVWVKTWTRIEVTTTTHLTAAEHSFQSKSAQTFAILSTVMQAMHEMRQAVVNNML